MPGWLGGGRRGSADRQLRHPLRPPAECAPVARPGVSGRRADARRDRRLMRIGIVGLGLIGGSLGLAACARGDVVTGYDADAEALRLAAERGAVGRTAESLAQAVADAELALVCGPVADLPVLAAGVLSAVPEGSAVSDVGSTKARLVESVGGDRRFVGRHPVCGAEARAAASPRS